MRPPDHDLAEIAAEIDGALPHPGPEQQQLLDRLKEQRARLSKSAFQLAVLGQFKRGKSTLLNAFVGYPLLSAGVLPLTTVPTFLSRNPTPQMRLKYVSGAEQKIEGASLEALAAEIAAATTEEQNPRNKKGLQKVDVGVPSSPWLDGLTLIDTPGVGSTHIHNTDTAHEALPECDAALFVCSVDPPITEVELRYLASICRTASRVIVVLNKIDLTEDDDSERAAAFLSSVLAQQGHSQIDPRIFPISARAALAARRRGDCEALRTSGLLELEQYIQSELVGQKRQLLTISIAKKMSDIVDALQIGAEMIVRALTTPLSELEEKIKFFEAASVEFQRERTDLEDLLTGEWRRTLVRLDHLCDEADNRARREIEGLLEKLGEPAKPQAARSEVELAMAAVFDREFIAIAATVDAELAHTTEVHQQRYRALAVRVGETAAALFHIASPVAAPEKWFHVEREPYWIGQAQVDSLTSLTVDGVARLLPRKLREQRQQTKLRTAVTKAVTRNISDLHWTMRQNIDNSFRRLLASSNEMVETSISSTNGLLKMARERRRSEDASLHQEIESARRSQCRLVELRNVLDALLQASA
jgi:GTPase SAR1 family protein